MAAPQPHHDINQRAVIPARAWRRDTAHTNPAHANLAMKMDSKMPKAGTSKYAPDYEDRGYGLVLKVQHQPGVDYLNVDGPAAGGTIQCVHRGRGLCDDGCVGGACDC